MEEHRVDSDRRDESDFNDDLYLASLGYTNEFKRDMTLWGSVGHALCCIQPLLSGGMFQLGMMYGGSVTVVYGFLTCFVFGPYYWCGVLSGRLGRFPSFVCGWLTFMAFLGGSTAIALAGMQQTVAMSQIYHFGFDSSSGKSPAPSQLAQYGIALAVVLACNCAAALPMKFIDRIAIASFGWLLFAALLIIVVIPVMARGHPGAGYAPACNPALGPAGCFNPNPTDQNSKFVFETNKLSEGAAFNNIGLQDPPLPSGGVGKKGNTEAYTFCNGLLMAQFLILSYDVPGHMAEETKRASFAVPRAILTAYFLGSALIFGFLLTFLYSITVMPNAAIPGYGITGSCQTVNGAPLFSAAESAAYGYPADTLVTGFGHLPPWSGTEIPETPNDGVPLNTGAGGCLLNNGLPFSYMPVGSVFYDAFAAKFPRCTPEQAFGPATWAWEEVAAPGQNGTTSTTVLVDTGRVGNGTVHNAFLCLPVPQGGCCDVTGAIAPTEQARDACVFFVFLPFIGVLFTETMMCVAASRFIYSFARDRGFPGKHINDFVMRVEPRTGSPMAAIALYTAVQVLFMSSWTNKRVVVLRCVVLNPQVAFSAVSGVNANGFLTTYGLPSLLRCTTALRSFRAAPEFDLGRASVPVALVSAAYGAFSVGTISMPNLFDSEGEVNRNILNYAPIVLTCVILLAVALYPFATNPRFGWNFRGPSIIMVRGQEDGARLVPEEEEGTKKEPRGSRKNGEKRTQAAASSSAAAQGETAGRESSAALDPRRSPERQGRSSDRKGRRSSGASVELAWVWYEDATGGEGVPPPRPPPAADAAAAAPAGSFYSSAGSSWRTWEEEGGTASPSASPTARHGQPQASMMFVSVVPPPPEEAAAPPQSNRQAAGRSIDGSRPPRAPQLAAVSSSSPTKQRPAAQQQQQIGPIH